MKNKIIVITLLISISGLLLLNQNCAQPSFMLSGDWSQSSESLLLEKQNFPNFNLLSANQVYQTFLTLTDQTEDTNNQRAEFALRRGSFSDQGEVQAINAPYLLAASSLAGTSCNELVTAERNRPEAERRIFKGINFNQGTASISDASFQALSRAMSQKFWNMDLDQAEVTILLDYKNTFLDQGSPDNATQTQNLLISTCSAILSNVRVISL